MTLTVNVKDNNIEQALRSMKKKLQREGESGRTKISLWEDQVDAVNNGDFVRVESAYTNEYNGVKALNLGKFGKIEKVDINATVE